MSTVSIIIPVYNAKKYVAKCIASIRKQTYQDWNLILVDDGSTDGSSEICDRLAAGDPRISVIHQANSGALKARLNGIAKATGDFIAFADADDMMEPAMLQKLLDVQAQCAADIVCCGNRTLSRRGFLKGKNIQSGSVSVTSGKEEAIRMAASTAGLSLWAKLFRRELFTRAKSAIDTVPNVFWGEDSILNTAIFQEADRVAILEDTLYDYRIGGLSQGSTEKTMRELSELYQWRKNYLLSVDAEIKYHKTNLAQVLNAAIYYTHYSRNVLSREKVCSELAEPIADIAAICPNYRHKNAFDMNAAMTDREFRGIYHEAPLVKIKQFLLRIL